MPSSLIIAWEVFSAYYAANAAFAFAVNMVASAIISKAFLSPSDYGASGQSPNPGNRQQIPPATDNKLPVIYGNAWLGGTITDMVITEDNQTIYFVLSLCEVTNSNSGSTPDTISFGNIYYAGKLVTFQADGYTVASLTDESTGAVDTSVDGKIQIYLYKNGSNQPTNSSISAITVLSDTNIIASARWDSNKLMSNCAFAIVKLIYNRDANITGLQQTKFNVINSRYATGDCFYDYLNNTRYGCAIPASQIDTTSLNALTTYSNGSYTYYPYGGGTATQTRFRFDGVLDTSRTCMQNLQDMASCCDCLLTYNEITAKWGVVVQQPTYTVAMDLNDSNMISAIQVSPIDLAGSYNVIECKFPDNSNKDAFNSASFDLAVLNPSLLYPNEPVNKMSISLPLVNNNVRAQLLANRFLKSAREDLQLQVTINYVGIQLQAGDIVTVTNANYGWTAKPFRINKVIETFTDDGAVTARLTLSEFNSDVYADTPVTQFTPAPNTGLADPNTFGIVPAPVISSTSASADIPLFNVTVTASSRGIIQYAEIWYASSTNPIASQRYFAGTTAIQSDGNPYAPNSVMPVATIYNIPAGNWYFFTRMVNSASTSNFSPASAVLSWRPSTYQYTQRYLNVAYANNSTGTSGFSLTPTNKIYYGLQNSASITASTNPADYTWYLADPNFGTTNYLLYTSRGSRKFSFDTGNATVAGTGGTFVPTITSQFPPTLWSALPNGTNAIDLDARTGYVLSTGGSTVDYSAGLLDVTNNTDGKLSVSLNPFLAPSFGAGVYSITSSAALITVDVYGRVVGFETPDSLYFTKQSFTATASQTVFSVTRASTYISGQCWVFSNGCLLNTTEYTDTGGSTGTVTLSTGAVAGTIITIISFRSVSTANLTTTGASGTGTVATITFGSRTTPPFQVGQSITVAGVTPTGYNGTYTVTACTNTTVSYANTTTGSQTVAGTVKYTNNTYRSFSRNTVALSNQSTYTASGFTLNSGFECLFVNGTILNDQDYDIAGQVITNFPSAITGDMEVIQWTPNNLGQPNGTPVNLIAYTVIGQTVYSFSYDANAFDLYSNGVLQLQGTDYTTATGAYTLANTPDTTSTVMVQQTFARTGAV